MKKISMVCALAVLGLVMTACEKNQSTDEVKDPEQKTQRVEFSFSPYEMRSMTRAVTSIASVVTRLDVWISDSEGYEVADVHQTSSDDGFGSISLTLDKTETYTIVAVGHKCAGAATLEDGIIAFPDDKVTHAMVYTTEFSPAEVTSLSCLMQRIVSQFSFSTTDACPEEATKMTFTIAGVYDHWSIDDGPTNEIDRTSTFDGFSKNQDGTVTFNIYAIVSDTQTTHDITVTAYDADDNILQKRTFEDVPLRNCYRTRYRGTFFTDTPVAASFTVADWNEYDVVDY